MREPDIYYQRLVDRQEYVSFTIEDGIDVLNGTVGIHTYLNCDHTELPSEVREIFNPSISEKRKKPHSSTHLFGIPRDI